MAIGISDCNINCIGATAKARARFSIYSSHSTPTAFDITAKNTLPVRGETQIDYLHG